MPVYGKSTGNLTSEFNFAVQSLNKVWAKYGVLMFRDTLSDEVAIIDGVSQAAEQSQGVVIEGSTFKPLALTEALTATENNAKIISRAGYQKEQLFGIVWSELEDELARSARVASMPGLTGKPQTFVLNKILQKLATGESATCLWDGKSYFHLEHLIDPLAPDVADNRYPNLYVEDLDSDGWNTVFQGLTTRPAPGHNTTNGAAFLPDRGLNGSNLSIWCGDLKVYSGLKKIFDPQAQWVSGNATETRKVYTEATIQYVPEMFSFDRNNIDNYVYLVLRNEPMMRGMYCRVPHPPTVTQTSAASDIEVTRQVRQYFGYQTFGQDFACPFKIVKWKFS